jgi:hypothetical protein
VSTPSASLNGGRNEKEPRWGALVQSLDVVQRVRFLFQVFPEIGMRDVDERQGTLANGLAVEVGNAMFRNNVANVVARSHNACAVLQHPGNAAKAFSAASGGVAGQGDNGHAAF